MSIHIDLRYLALSKKDFIRFTRFFVKLSNNHFINDEILKLIILLHSIRTRYPAWRTSQFIKASKKSTLFFLLGRQRRNSRTRCNRCGHRCNIFMLWTGRVRAINSGGVGRVKERERERRNACRGAVRRGARGQSDYVSQTPHSLARPSHRHHHPPPFCSLQPPRASPQSRPPPRLRARLVPPDPLRRLNNPIRLFPTRMCAYTEVCNFGVGNARYWTNDRRSAY